MRGRGGASFIRILEELKLHVRAIAWTVLDTPLFQLPSRGLLLACCFYCTWFSWNYFQKSSIKQKILWSKGLRLWRNHQFQIFVKSSLVSRASALNLSVLFRFQSLRERSLIATNLFRRKTPPPTAAPPVIKKVSAPAPVPALPAPQQPQEKVR